MESLGKYCRHLKVLGIDRCINIDNSGLSRLLTHAPHLKFVSADDCKKISMDAFKVFCGKTLNSNANRISELYLNKCKNINDATVEMLARALSSHLTCIGVEYVGIGDNAVRSLAQHCRKLRVIGRIYNTFIFYIIVIIFINNMNTGLNGNKLVTDASVETLIINCRLSLKVQRIYLTTRYIIFIKSYLLT